MRGLIIGLFLLAGCGMGPHPWEDLYTADPACLEALKAEALKGSRAVPSACQTIDEYFAERDAARAPFKKARDEGIQAFEAGDYERALAAFNKAIDIENDNIDQYFNLAATYLQLNRFEDAIATYDEIIALDHDNEKAYRFRAVAYKELNQFEEAIAKLDQSVSVDPTNANVYYDRGEIKYNLKRYKDAIADFDKAIEINPEYAYAYNTRGYSLINLSRYEEAITDFDRAIEINLGQLSKAKADCVKARALITYPINCF